MNTATNEVTNMPRGFNPEIAFAFLEKKMERARTQNKMSAIRLMFDKILELQREGMSLEDIVEGLAEAGLDISVATLKSAMMRIRKERGIKLRKRGKKIGERSSMSTPAKHQASDIPAAEKEGFGRSMIKDRPAIEAPAPVVPNQERQLTAKERALKVAEQYTGQDVFAHPPPIIE